MPDPAAGLGDLHRRTRIPPADLVGKLQKKYQDRNGTDRVLELDYLGHAAVTDILLDTDPLWTWEPAAVDDLGRPVVDRDKDGWPRGLWIRLTVLGHTRLGYGTCPAGKQDAIKELIGDAVRNAAMRFGVGLSLWAKEEWQEEGIERKEVSGTTGGSRAGAGPSLDQRSGEENSPGPGNVTQLPQPTQADIARHPANLPKDQAIAARAQALGLTDDERQDAIEKVTAGRTRSGKDVYAREVPLVIQLLEAMAKARA